MSSFEYPVEVEVLVGLDEGLGAGLPSLVAVDGRSGSVQEVVEAVPPDSIHDKSSRRHQYKMCEL